MRIFDPETGIDVDGVWNDMNEGSNFCPDIQCDPAQLAKDSNDPPLPTHSPRPNTGRPIPRFPDDFQPGSPSSLGTIQARQQQSEGNMKGLPGGIHSPQPTASITTRAT